jgi:release factor glutamine methyltransferase
MEFVTFRGLRLLTAPGLVMTPRPASEKIVAAAVALIGDRHARVIDVGTGSGAIAIAIATALPQVEVFATDVSAAAVALARLNVGRLGLSERVTVCRGDLLEPIPGPVDLIVANLPYLPIAEMARQRELANEPQEAVFASGDGLEPYRRLIVASRKRLAREGALIIQLYGDVLMARREGLDRLAATMAGRTPLRPTAASRIAA